MRSSDLAVSDTVSRLRRVLSSVRLDCLCRATLDDALDRFLVLEHRRRLRGDLLDARRRRDWIATQLTFLADLDDLDEREVDKTVFAEMALLFEGIAAEAAKTAQAFGEVGKFASAHRPGARDKLRQETTGKRISQALPGG
ncbi:MAG: hypothetical protein KDJ88_02570 [Bauldia sp.]|nr:hypothetical protein [Bauldia sp.]